MTKTAKAAVAFTLALVLLVLKSALPPLVTRQVRLLPVDESLQITTQPAAATLFDAAAWAAGTPTITPPTCTANSLECYLTHPTLTSTIQLSARAGETKKEVGLEVVQNLVTDSGQELYSAQDEVVLARHSSIPVDRPVSSLQSHSIVPSFTHDLFERQRDGLQYAFPYATEFRSYHFFDAFSATSTPIDFQDRETIQDVTVFRFHQQLAPIQLSGDTIKGLASQFYSPEEIASQGLTAGNTVMLNKYYSMSRTLWVEPKTGTIVDSEEHPRIFLARDSVEAQRGPLALSRTLFDVTLRWDEATKRLMWDRAIGGVRTLKTVAVGLLAATIASAALIVFGMLYLRRKD